MPTLFSFFAADSVFWALLKNASLLIALAYAHSLMPITKRPLTALRQLGMGFLLGLIGVAIITSAYRFQNGIIFDTRSILIGITGLYFGVIPTTVLMLITAAYRLWQGGPNAPTGVLVIFTSGLIGLAWRHLLKPDLAHIKWRELIVFGFAVHGAMMTIFLIFPVIDQAAVFAAITLPVLGIYPLATALLGKFLSSRIQRVTDAQRLKQSEKRFKLIFKGANDGWWDWDLTTNEVTYSPRWWEMLGMKPGDRNSSPEIWRELTHPEDNDRVHSLFTKALASSTENQYEVEFRLLHRDGHYINVISRGHIERDDQRQALRVSGTNVDITQMRRALDEANAARSLLESAGRIGRIGYWEVSFKNSSIFWSDITANIHDLPAGTEVTFREALNYFPEQYHATIERDVSAVRGGQPFESQYEIITATGRRIWTQARGEPVVALDGRVTGMRGVLQDIDSAKRATDALRLSERNYQEIFNASSDAILIREDSTGRILDVNDAMVRMYGFSDKAAALAANIADLSSGELSFTESAAHENDRVALERGSHTFPWQARRADGSTFWVEVSLRRTQIGGEGRILASVRDISKRKALEERVREAEKMESLGRLAGGIAHDFNNMLSVIIGHADLARHRIEPGEAVCEDLEQIRRAADRSADLVRQLLSFARRQDITPRIIDLNQAVSSTLTMLRRLIGENISLHWHPDETLWPVKIDPVQVDQILTNLAINARDAISDHGSITIRTRNQPGPSGGDHVTLKVTDTGSGIDTAILKNVFEPFFTTKSIGEGTGLGLATVHGIVKQNGGYIQVESQPGSGTTFLIHLPRQVAPEAPVPTVTRPPVAHGSENILLVEDEPAILFLATQALTMMGYNVLAAPSPVEALEIAARSEETIDLVISDMIMPGMSGRDLREAIIVMRPGLRFLFVSGYTDGLGDNLADDPTVDFLAKPFSIEALGRKTRESIDKLLPPPLN